MHEKAGIIIQKSSPLVAHRRPDPPPFSAHTLASRDTMEEFFSPVFYSRFVSTSPENTQREMQMEVEMLGDDRLMPLCRCLPSSASLLSFCRCSRENTHTHTLRHTLILCLSPVSETQRLSPPSLASTAVPDIHQPFHTFFAVSRSPSLCLICLCFFYLFIHFGLS